jgi:hypothetical protein
LASFGNLALMRGGNRGFAFAFSAIEVLRAALRTTSRDARSGFAFAFSAIEEVAIRGPSRSAQNNCSTMLISRLEQDPVFTRVIWLRLVIS